MSASRPFFDALADAGVDAQRYLAADTPSQAYAKGRGLARLDSSRHPPPRIYARANQAAWTAGFLLGRICCGVSPPTPGHNYVSGSTLFDA